MTIAIEIIETSGLGDRSYVAHDGHVAIVVDPQRDIDRVEAVLTDKGVRLELVVETHLHNDYVTGGYALAQAHGVPYAVAAADEVSFERVPARDGDRYEVGRMTLTVVATPGHTPNHLSYVLGEAGGDPLAVFTGGSMLFGAVGRTDLIDPGLTDELTRAQYRSVRQLASRLEDSVAVHPTHGFGSFCSATETTGDASTVGEERRQNVALTTADEDQFVKVLVDGLSAYPRYYVHMAPRNAAGPEAPDLSPPEPVDATELRRRIDAGEWVVDLRQRIAFARSHLLGTISVELGDLFTTYLGWTMPQGTPLTLVGESVEQLVEARRALSRIGIDELAGGATGTPETLGAGAVGSYEVADFAALARAHADADKEGGHLVVLDVRRPDEWEAGHLVDAIHVPLWEVEARANEVPEGTVWVHCGIGFRASIGASLLARAGRNVVHVDDDWANAANVGLPITT